jgi:hypothetical protein
VFAAGGRRIGGCGYQRADLAYQQIVCRWLHDLLLRSRSGQMIPDFGSPQAGRSHKSKMLPATDCALHLASARNLRIPDGRARQCFR